MQLSFTVATVIRHSRESGNPFIQLAHPIYQAIMDCHNKPIYARDIFSDPTTKPSLCL